MDYVNLLMGWGESVRDLPLFILADDLSVERKFQFPKFVHVFVFKKG